MKHVCKDQLPGGTHSNPSAADVTKARGTPGDKKRIRIKLYFTLVVKTINISFKLCVTNGNKKNDNKYMESVFRFTRDIEARKPNIKPLSIDIYAMYKLNKTHDFVSQKGKEEQHTLLVHVQRIVSEVKQRSKLRERTI